VTLPKNEDPTTVSLEKAIALINDKREQERKRHIKTFKEEPKLEVLNGRYGPYLDFDGTNYRLPKNLHSKAADLTLQQCMDLIQSASTKKK